MNIRVTVVTKSPYQLFYAPSATYVLTSDEIRRSGAVTLPDLLRRVPGVHVGQVDSHQWGVSSRGFTDTFANKQLVMIDGRSIYSPLFAGIFWDMHDIFIEDVDRIESVRGPGATLWGANAVNGVINVRTKDASMTQGSLVYGGVGNIDRFGGVRHGWALSQTAHMRVYAKYIDRLGARFPGGSRSYDGWQAYRGGFRADWRPGSEQHVTVQGDAYIGEVLGTPRQIDPAPPHTVSHARRPTDIHGGYVLARYSGSAPGDSEISFQTFIDHNVRDINRGFRENRTTFDVELQHVISLGWRHRITSGIGFRLSSDWIRSSFEAQFIPNSVTDHLLSAFIQDEIALLEDRLTLTLGAKVEHNDYTGWEVQPSARMSFRLSPQQVLWAAISRSVRTPTRGEHHVRFNEPLAGNSLIPTKFAPLLELLPPGIMISNFGNPDFHSEELVAYELGYRAWPHKRVNLDLAVFYHDYRQLRSIEFQGIASEPPPTHLRVIVGNGLRGEAYGGELTALWRPTDFLQVRASYSLLRMFFEATSTSRDPVSADALAGTSPRHQAQLGVAVDLPAGWEFDVNGRYVDNLPSPGISSYVGLDVRLAWQPWKPGPEFSIVGQNLLQDQHAEFMPLFARDGVLEIERSIYGKVTWRF